MKISIRQGDAEIVYEENQESTNFLKVIGDNEKVLKTIEHITSQVIRLNTLEKQIIMRELDLIRAQQKEIEQLKEENKRWENELDLQIRFLNIERKENNKLKEENKALLGVIVEMTLIIKNLENGK